MSSLLTLEHLSLPRSQTGDTDPGGAGDPGHQGEERGDQLSQCPGD